MLRESPALLMVFLWFVCVSAVTPQHDRRCTRDTIPQVEVLLRKAPEKLSCRLYTPTVRDFEICPGVALRCFAEELNVLAEEWELKWRPGRTRPMLNFRIQKLASFFNQTESECSQCELLKEEDAETFLSNLIKTLENMNFRFCPQRTAASTKGF